MPLHIFEPARHLPRLCHVLAGLDLERSGAGDERSLLRLLAEVLVQAVDALLDDTHGHPLEAPLDVGYVNCELHVAGRHRRVCRASARRLARKAREGEVGRVGRGHCVHLARPVDRPLGLGGGDEGALVGVDVELAEPGAGVGEGLPSQAVRDQRPPPPLLPGEVRDLDVQPVARSSDVIVDVIAVNGDRPRRALGVGVEGESFDDGGGQVD